MKREEDIKLYGLLDSFIEHSILDDKSTITNNGDDCCCSVQNIEECITRFFNNPDLSRSGFESKIEQQFEGASDAVKLTFAHAEWLWVYSVNDISKETKKSYITARGWLKNGDSLSDVYPDHGFGNAGQYHKTNKFHEISFCLHLMKYLKGHHPKDTQSVKNKIKEICLWHKYNKEKLPEEIQACFQNELAMGNIFLYLVDPEKYERISSVRDKNAICNTFSSLIADPSKNTDDKIYDIRNGLKRVIEKDFDFYEDPHVYSLWKPTESANKEFLDIQALEYKKALILYGPPGTSKTHSANELAKRLFWKTSINKENIKDYLEGEEGRPLTSHHIRKLQLHSNYNYEDFIVCKTLKDNSIVVEKGYFTKLCEEINADKSKLPYVLILDEINRVDISRLFGELFSALENRDESITLSVGSIELKVPSNLYLIGTMNEIDFSLERVDFALRRRFCWSFYGYNSNVLSEMMDSRGLTIKDKDRYLRNVEKLNDAISEDDDLGMQYQIGHTFFAEIIDIVQQYNSQNPKREVNLYDKPVKILWDISIAPLLDAFLGTMDRSNRETKIRNFYDKLTSA